MLFSSYTEFGTVLLFLCIHFILRIFKLNIPLKAWLFIGNFAVLSMVLKIESWIAHVLISALVFFLSQWMNKVSRIKAKRILATTITLLVIGFIIRNYSSGNSFLVRLGLSYILFRHIQFLLDSYRQKVQVFSLLDYINFILFFPNFLSGPIDTYINFKRWIDKPMGNASNALILPGIAKIGLGVIKKFGFVPLVMTYAVDYNTLTPEYGMALGLLLSLFSYSAYIYLDFSGYSDIAIGTGYLIGVRTPENFRSPYLSSDISEFWQRWHMTFSLFLRNNIFKPSLYLINTYFFSAPRLLVSSFGYIITFVICGLWHGNTLNFVYWGLWHGVGLVILKLYGQYLKPQLSGKSATLYNGLMIPVTFIYVSIGWAFFHYNHEQLVEIIKAL